MSKKNAVVKTELDVKASKIQVKATERAQSQVAVAASSDFALFEAVRRAEMKVIKATQDTNQTLLAIKAKIEAANDKTAVLRDEYDAAFRAAYPQEYAKQKTLSEIKAALISWLGRHEAVAVNGIIVKTYADAREAYQKTVEQKVVEVAVASS